MDYESKILFNRLIEAVDSPDWWIIALTIINTIAVIGIAGVQIWMQWQQTKMQEHKMYKDLYSLLNSIHNIGDSTIHNIALVLKNYCYNIDKEFCIKYLEKRKQEIDELSLKLSEHKIDLELKTNIRNIEYINYESFLWAASYLIDDFVFLMKDNGIQSYDIDEKQTFSENDLIDSILSSIENSKRADYKKKFVYYVNLKGRIAKYNILSSLKEHCIL